jgi:hypothetical protein
MRMQCAVPSVVHRTTAQAATAAIATEVAPTEEAWLGATFLRTAALQYGEAAREG